MLIIMFAMLISLPALAAKPGGSPEAPPPLLAVFSNVNSSDCGFRYLSGSLVNGSWDNGLAIFQIGHFIPGAGSIIIDTEPTTDAGQTRMLEYFIRINGLSLAPAAFRDPSTGEFVCTNDKLFSLL
jgi:hypothetical protein